MHYGFRITNDSLPLVTFLNDGVAPQVKNGTTFLVCAINGPCEITTKVVSESELNQSVEELLLPVM